MMERNWQKMLAAIAHTEDEELTCADLTAERLTLYAEAVLASADAEQRFPRIRQHLDQCPDCALQLDDIVAMLRLAQANELVEPLRQPAFDLSFLPAVAAQPSLPAQVQALFAQGHLWMRDQVETLWINLAAAFAGPINMQPVLVTKGKNETPGALIFQLARGAEELGDLDLEVTATQEENPDQCTLVVRAQVPSRWPDLGGVEVALLRGGEVRTAYTDEQGQAVFYGFPVAELSQVRFKITPPAAGSAAVG